MNWVLTRLTATAILIGLMATASPAGSAQGRDEVRRAIESGAHGQAISLALEALHAKPDDPELRFLLARAYAYSGKWDEAEKTLAGLLADFPANTDYLVFKARLLCWREDFAGAESLFKQVLELNPRVADALAGLADLASWKGDADASLVYCRQALDLDPNHAGALFRTGSVLMAQGSYGQARGYFARAVELEPGNRDFIRALENASPLFNRKTEVWLATRNESFSDGRPVYADLEASALFSLFKDRSKFVVKAGRSWRGGGHDDKAGLEAYPHLWKGAYGYFDLSVAPGSDFAARSSIHLEVYQSLLTRFEVSLGARRMAFPAEEVSMAVGSAAGYWGPWYANVRLFYADTETGSEFTWLAGARRYFTDDSFAWAALGRGSRSFEAGSIEDVLVGPSWFAELGCDVYVLRDFKLRASLFRSRESGGPSSTAFSVVAGYRW